MFRKRQRKQEYMENKIKISDYNGKRSLRFSVKYNSRFIGKSEFHYVGKLRDELVGLRAAKKASYITTASSSILGNRSNQQDSFFFS